MTTRPNIKLDPFERALRDDPPYQEKPFAGWVRLVVLWSTIGLLILWIWASLFAVAYHWQ